MRALWANWGRALGILGLLEIQEGKETMTYYDLTPELQKSYQWLDDVSKQAPLEWVGSVIRFKRNLAVGWAQEHSNLNDMWIEASRNKWPLEDMMSFYRQIGYSLSGFGDIFHDDGMEQGHC